MGLNLLKKNQVELVGLDIGSAFVKLVRLKKSGQTYSAVSAVIEPIQLDSDASNRQAAGVEAVKRCFSKAGVKSQNVVCGVSGAEVVVRGFKFPPLPLEAIDQAVQMEARQVCPLDMKNSVLDYQLIETVGLTKEEQKAPAMPRNGIMVVASQNVVKEKSDILAELGGKPIMVDAEALALLNCLNELHYLDDNQTVAFVNVGAAYTNIVIYGKDGLPFVRDLNQAGGSVIRQISRKLEISDDQVREGLNDDSAQDDQLYNQILLAMNDAIRPLAMSINETLRFYSFQQKGESIDKIFLCGGFSLVNTFVEFLTDSLPAETEILNPFDKIQCRAGTNENELLKTCGPAFAVATGLAMRTL